MATVASLQKRRSGLVRQHQAQRAMIDRLLASLVVAYNKADSLEGRIAVIDLALNDHIDSQIHRLALVPELGTDENLDQDHED